MVKESIPPLVNGISPAEGPPGTVVKIRGENLGTSSFDVMGVFICNVNCTYTVEWKNSGLLHARTGVGLGVGDIIVFTKSAGKGTSFVKFRGFTPRVGLLTEAAVWVDESKLFEEKPSTTLSTTRTLSPNAAYVDPLGVAPEETGAMLPTEQIEEWYPGCSSNPLHENFDPSRFLLERHLDTTFDALKSGYYHLQSQDTRTSVGPTSFVRGNLSTILSALHTLNDVQKSMITHESESIGGNVCEELQGVLQSCVLASNLLFKDILTRKDNCDVKRNVLNVLHRYRFLFNLPRSIEKNIQQGEYEILISDYNRAKALFQNTEVKSFKKALTEVDQKITAFSKKLKQKLFDFPTPVEEQKKLIRYLNELDYPGNAGWECITKQTLWFKSMLLDCQVEHQENESNNKLNTPPPEANLRPNEGSHTALSPGFADVLLVPGHKRTPSEPSNISFSRSHTRTASLPESLRKLHGEPTRKPEGILMVEDLCKLITDNLSDLWNLGQTYLSNQLGDKKHNASHVNEERQKFQSLVEDVIIVFCDMVQNVLHPEDSGRLTPSKERELRILVPWYPDAVKSVRATLERLIKLGLTEEVLSPLKTLTTDCICDCVKKVLSSIAEEVKNLHRQEFWELEYDRRGSYWISQLPSKFEKLFADAIQFVHDFLTDSKLDKIETKAIHQIVVDLLGTMLEAFLLTLERTIYPDELSDSNEELQDQAGPEDMQQVIVLLSNCHHVKELVTPHVIAQCVRYGYEEIQDLNEEITIAIAKLDERVFSTYIEKKGDPLVGSIELGMNMAEYDWNGAQPVEGVRAYMKDLLMSFVYIHDQISSVSTIFNKRIFVALIDRVVEEYQRIYACIDKFSAKGSLQAHVELAALKSALQLYISEDASSIVDGITKRLLPLDEKYKKRLDAMLSSFQESMRYQLSTFGPPEKQVSSDPKENPMSKLRSKSIEALDQGRSRTSSVGKVGRARKKSKSTANRQSWSAEVQVEKSDPPPQKTLLTLVEKADAAASAKQSDLKKTKRKAPPPPSVLASKETVVKLDPTNPFFDDEDEV